MLLTLLGVIALIQRERKKVNNTPSVFATSNCSDDIPQITVCAASGCTDDDSSARLSDDVLFFTATSKLSYYISFFIGTSKLSDGVSFFTAMPKLSDGVSFFTATPKLNDDVLFFTATPKLSDGVSFFTGISKLNDGVLFFTAMPKLSDGVSFFIGTSKLSDGISFFTATSKLSDDVSFFTAMPKLSDDVLFFIGTSKLSDGVSFFTAMPKLSDDVLFFIGTSKLSDGVSFFTAMPNLSDDVLFFIGTSKLSDGISFFTATSKLSDDVSFFSATDVVLFYSGTSKLSDDVSLAFFSAKSILSVDVPPASFPAMSKCSDDVPQALFSVTSKSSDDVPPALFSVTSKSSDDLQDNETTIIDINSHRYEIGSQLGEGGFGTVYAATRLDDGLQVSVCITYIIFLDGCSKPLPLEVALQILANKRPRVEEIIQLLDWQVDPDYYFMVLERPMPCQSLYEYLKCYKGTMEEDVARVIMHQAIFAARMCCLRGVLHRDIKLENLLINPDTLELKLIDFGCGAILTDVGYTSFAGSREYCPPEYHMTGKYHGEPGTVWSLGILLFVILFSKFPKRRHLHKINAKNWTKAGLSKECCDLIRRCLQIDPKQRIELGKLSLHDWFMVNTFYRKFSDGHDRNPSPLS
uniref:non-specific serine/threonine protein kinase n=1 Tax=Sinocyclocheilus grahami TaxID=75366 RepID=A0A672RSC1_SINGR